MSHNSHRSYSPFLAVILSCYSLPTSKSSRIITHTDAYLSNKSHTLSFRISSISYSKLFEIIYTDGVLLQPLPLIILDFICLICSQQTIVIYTSALHHISFQLDMIIHIALLRNDPTFS
ncbi:unnamed protein product [Musa acuminata subsp. burmannicoides]